MFYLITNTKTKLSKLVTEWDYSPEQLKDIVNFYKKHNSFTITRLA